jgi:hypothetical protein|nr:hypothetical protein [Aerosticca soli]
MAPVVQGQQISHFIEIETQVLQMLDKAQTARMRLVVSAEA